MTLTIACTILGGFLIIVIVQHNYPNTYGMGFRFGIQGFWVLGLPRVGLGFGV